MRHIDLTSFRTIISDWFDEREFAEQSLVSLTPEGLALARCGSFLSKLKPVVGTLKRMGKDTDVLNDALLFWFNLDRQNFTGAITAQREIREGLLYMLIEDYFFGQGYQTSSAPLM